MQAELRSTRSQVEAVSKNARARFFILNLPQKQNKKELIRPARSLHEKAKRVDNNAHFGSPVPQDFSVIRLLYFVVDDIRSSEFDWLLAGCE